MATTESMTTDTGDLLTRFLLPETHCRGALLRGRHIIEEGRRMHGLNGPIVALFGQTLLASIMMLSISKGGMRQVLQLDATTEAPLKRLLAEARAGAVRGLVSWQEEHQILHHAGDNDQGLRSWIGHPVRLTTVRDMGFGHPYISSIEHDSDYLADHLIHYLGQSVQIRADLILHGDVALMIEAMPGCDEDRWFEAVKAMARIPESTLANGDTDSILAAFAPLEVKVAGQDLYHYRCDCSDEKMKAAIEGMPAEQLRELADDDGNITLSCQYCDRFYVISLGA